jgi:lysophospholipase L1-like esterase
MFVEPLRRRSAIALCIVTAMLLAGPVDAATILAMGDSITYGTRSLETGGYLKFLDELTPSFYQLVGPEQTLIPPEEIEPYPDAWNHHFGLRGIEADGVADVDGSNSLLFESIHSDVLNLTQPDVVLLHIGTNSLDVTNESAEGAFDQLSRLLDYFRTALPSKTQVLLAEVLPKTNRSSGDPTVNRPAVYQTWRYNDMIHGFIGSMAGDDPLYGRLHPLDMFKIDLRDATLGMTHLLEDPAVNAQPNDDYVDWVLDLDEALGMPEGDRDRNTSLLIDALHPTALGYSLMAHVWYKGIVNALPFTAEEQARLTALSERLAYVRGKVQALRAEYRAAVAAGSKTRFVLKRRLDKGLVFLQDLRMRIKPQIAVLAEKKSEYELYRDEAWDDVYGLGDDVLEVSAGSVTGGELIAFSPTGLGEPTAIPEPATMAVVVVAGLVLIGRRGR